MWIQGPLSLISGLGLFFSIPKTFSGGEEGEGSISAKLARIDYFGAFTLVCLLLDLSVWKLKVIGYIRGPLPVRTFIAQDRVHSYHHFFIPSHWIYLC